METSDRDRIYVTNPGSAPAPPKTSANSSPANPWTGRIYFRPAPRLASTGQHWAWLHSRPFVATGERSPDEVRLEIFTVN